MMKVNDYRGYEIDTRRVAGRALTAYDCPALQIFGKKSRVEIERAVDEVLNTQERLSSASKFQLQREALRRADSDLSDTAPRTTVTISMSAETRDRLLKKWQEDPEAVRSYFAAGGFPLVDLKPVE